MGAVKDRRTGRKSIIPEYRQINQLYEKSGSSTLTHKKKGEEERGHHNKYVFHEAVRRKALSDNTPNNLTQTIQSVSWESRFGKCIERRNTSMLR